MTKQDSKKGVKKTERSSNSQWSSDKFFGTAALLALSALSVSLLVSNGAAIRDYFLPFYPKGAIAKKYLDFQSFFPFYLEEHSDLNNQISHGVGTALIVFGMLTKSPRTLASLGLALPFGHLLFYTTLSFQKGFVEMATVLLAFVIINKLTTGSHMGSFLIALFGYGFAWFGHFYFQHNVPATFTYPTFSLMGDFRLFGELVFRQVTQLLK